MANMHLVTGYAGQEHVTAADHGNFNAAMFGTGQYVLKIGNMLAASVIASNQVRILDGDILMQGRHVRLNEGTYVDLTIENGTQGMLRNDLIVARYTKNASTGVEEVNLVVIKGTADASSPVDPEYTVGDLIEDHAIQNDMPLYRIPLNGINVQAPVPLFSVNTNVAEHADRHANGGADPITPEAIGALPDDSPFLWRTVDLLPFNYNSTNSTPYEFAYADYKTTRKVICSMDLPKEVDVSKYDYELRLTVYGSTMAYEEEASAYSTRILFIVSLGGAGLYATDLWSQSIGSTYLMNGEQALGFPMTLNFHVQLNAECSITEKYGYEKGEIIPHGQYIGVGNSPSLSEEKTANTITLTVQMDQDEGHPTQTFGIRFEYRAVCERSAAE